MRNLAIWGSIRHNHCVLASQSPPAPPTQKQTWTILEVLRWTIGRFERHGMASARLDAELLATQAFGRTRVELYTHFDQPLGDPELGAYRALVKRRMAGESVAYPNPAPTSPGHVAPTLPARVLDNSLSAGARFHRWPRRGALSCPALGLRKEY